MDFHFLVMDKSSKISVGKEEHPVLGIVEIHGFIVRI